MHSGLNINSVFLIVGHWVPLNWQGFVQTVALMFQHFHSVRVRQLNMPDTKLHFQFQYLDALSNSH